jgi:hypothetical protein
MSQNFGDILEQFFNATRMSYFNIAVSVFNINLKASRSHRKNFWYYHSQAGVIEYVAAVRRTAKTS